MILPDVNVLVHAHNADSALHDRARLWWDACLAGTEGIGLAWAAMLGFVRITTNRRVVARPLPVRHIMEQLRAWLTLPHVHIAQPSNTHFARLRAGTRAPWDRRQPHNRRPLGGPHNRAGIFCVQPIRILPGLAASAGLIPASKPAAHNTVKGV